MRKKEFNHQGQLLKEYRLKSGMSQNDLAVAVNRNKQLISNMERGIQGFSKHIMLGLNKHLKVPKKLIKEAYLMDAQKYVENALKG